MGFIIDHVQMGLNAQCANSVLRLCKSIARIDRRHAGEGILYGQEPRLIRYGSKHHSS